MTYDIRNPDIYSDEAIVCIVDIGGIIDHYYL